MSNDRNVIFNALLSHRDALESHRDYVSLKGHMALETFAINRGFSAVQNNDNATTACNQLRFAQNRFEYWTTKALIVEHFEKDSRVERETASRWLAYRDNEKRQEQANAEDQARCDRAEAREVARHESYYR